MTVATLVIRIANSGSAGRKLLTIRTTMIVVEIVVVGIICSECEKKSTDDKKRR